MAPLVSVIVPTYNRAKVIGGAVDAILAQTHRPIELIIVNDGSTDDTAQVLAALQPKVRAADVEPVFIHQKNGGVASAINAGLRAMKGDFFGFQGDDDTWYPHKLQRQLEEIEKTRADACSCLVLEAGAGIERVWPSDPARLFKGRNPAAYVRGESDGHIIAMIYASSLLPRVGEFDPQLRNAEDSEWKLRLVHEATFCAVPEVLARYAITEGALSRFKGYKGLIERDRHQERVLLLARERCAHREGWDEQNWRRVAAKAFSEYVKHYLYGGELDKARETFERGMNVTGAAPELARVKRKLLKARVLGWFGLRLKHPKLANIDDFKA